MLNEPSPQESRSGPPPNEAAGGEPRDGIGTVGWWLRLQLGLGLGGGLVWLAGVLLHSDFAAGLGAGLLVAALALRLGRRAAARGEGP